MDGDDGDDGDGEDDGDGGDGKDGGDGGGISKNNFANADFFAEKDILEELLKDAFSSSDTFSSTSSSRTRNIPG